MQGLGICQEAGCWWLAAPKDNIMGGGRGCNHTGCNAGHEVATLCCHGFNGLVLTTCYMTLCSANCAWLVLPPVNVLLPLGVPNTEVSPKACRKPSLVCSFLTVEATYATDCVECESSTNSTWTRDGIILLSYTTSEREHNSMPSYSEHNPLSRIN